MKSVFAAFIALYLVTAAISQSKKPSDEPKFDSETVDLGKPKVVKRVT